ncbi:TPM domain-containing protein [Rugamonas sp. CCM 8940]|uniref:TPM domain-containing protein n=1 Tax=Rugamonas sp. CCM 8940 TaxID=2765359 RepID=UPI0018F69ADD|nr:YgcG family protein [Rugamonas sp. CCM 8940]MBJ7311833.1 YgcG family protein [Rugamonas sp. CCM 8940]
MKPPPLHSLALLLVLWLAAGLPASAQQLLAVPALSAHVTDQAGMLDTQQHGALEAVLADYEAKTGSQIAVLLVKSTAPEAIEQYSIRVSDAWKLGRKGVDDGVLLLVAKDNPPALRRLRIEAGRGVQGVLTDAQSKRVLQDVIAPHFRQNDFYGGLVAGVGAISTLLNQEKFPAGGQNAAPGEAESDLVLWLPLLFFAALVAVALLRSRGGPRVARGSWGAGAKGVLLGAVLNELSQSGRHGGGFGGGGGGGGGFSGGGGGFDGGGASGNW